ncbi:MAG: hypothetical protein P1Q69_03085 [Candidatus Thorarchaeota archaeon]|nr:hypothetical protein [Candidatus Thorarchaeota archaeon]
MTYDEADRVISDYLKSVARKLPDSFETDDMLDEIRAHILESLRDKALKNPKQERLVLAKEVLDNLGDPEDIAAEWGKAQEFEEEEQDQDSNIVRAVLKQTLALVVIVVAAWFVSTIPNSIVDFWSALIILLVFFVAEYFLRSWQKGETSKIEADIDRKR